MATRADVAKRAGVSPSTVSYVLNGERPTSEETKARVMKAITELGYVPHRWAGNLAARSLRTIGLHLGVGDYVIDQIAGEYIAGMRDRAAELGIMLTIPVVSHNDPESFRVYLRSRVFDALIMMEVSDGDWRESVVEEERIPAVFLGSPGTNRIPFVESDFFDIGLRAVDYAYQRGYQRCIVVARSEDRVDFNRMTDLIVQGVKQARDHTGADVAVLRLPSCPVSAFAILDQLSLSEHHTVVMGDNAEALTTLVSISPRFGLNVGQDYSLVTLGARYRVDLGCRVYTTESGTDRYQMGRTCVDKVVARFNGDGDVPSVFFPAQIIDGDTLA